MANDALRMADEYLDTHSRATAHLVCGYSCYCKGFFDEAEGHLLKAIEYCQRMDLSPWYPYAAFFVGNAYSDSGDHDQATHYHAEALSLFERGGFAPWLEVARIALARARVLAGDKDIDMGLVYEWARSNKARFYDSQIASFVGEILLHLGDEPSSEAENWITKAIELDTDSRMMFFLGKDHVLLSELYMRMGDKQKAKESLSKGIEILDQCGADARVKLERETMAKLQEAT